MLSLTLLQSIVTHTDLHCPDTGALAPAGHLLALSGYRGTGTGWTLAYTVRIQKHWHRLDTCLHCPDVEHTAQTGHLITPSGYRTHNTCRTFIYTVRIQNTRHRPDTYLHCPDTRTQSTHQKFNDTVQIREHRAQAGHLLTRSTTYTNMWIGRTLTDTVHGMHKQHITPVS